MAERVPQNGRYFQFLRIALISTFSRSPTLYPLSSVFAYVHSYFLSSIALLSQQSLCSPLCNLPLFFRRSLTYYWKAIVFSCRRFSYGAVIFHDPILERREHEQWR